MDQNIDNQVIDESTPAASGADETVETATPDGGHLRPDVQRAFDLLAARLIAAGSFPENAHNELSAFFLDLVGRNEALATLLTDVEGLSEMGIIDIVREIDQRLGPDGDPRPLFDYADSVIVFNTIRNVVDEIREELVANIPEEHTEATAAAENIPDGPESMPVETEPITDEELTRPRHRERRMRESKNFMVDLTPERIQQLEHEKSNHIDRFFDLKEEKRCVNAKLNAKISTEEGKIQKLTQSLNAGREEVTVQCAWYYDWEIGRRELIREDTLEVLKGQPIPFDELRRWREAQEPTLFEGTDEAEQLPEEPEPVPLFAQLACNVCGWIWDLGGVVAEPPEGTVCPGDGCTSRAFSVHGDIVGFEESLHPGTGEPMVEVEGNELAADEPATEGTEDIAATMGAIADAAYASESEEIEGEVDQTVPDDETAGSAVDELTQTAATDAESEPQDAFEGGDEGEGVEDEKPVTGARRRGRPRRSADA